MADSTKIVVGIALEENSPEWRNTPEGMWTFSAGYEFHEEGPTGILGYPVKSTWNDAINLDDYSQEIQRLRERFREITGKDAQLWVIGHQT